MTQTITEQAPLVERLANHPNKIHIIAPGVYDRFGGVGGWLHPNVPDTDGMILATSDGEGGTFVGRPIGEGNLLHYLADRGVTFPTLVNHRLYVWVSQSDVERAKAVPHTPAWMVDTTEYLTDQITFQHGMFVAQITTGLWALHADERIHPEHPIRTEAIRGKTYYRWILTEAEVEATLRPSAQAAEPEVEPVVPLEEVTTCARHLVSGQFARSTSIRDGAIITYFPDRPWWSLEGEYVLVVVEGDYPGGGGSVFDGTPRPVRDFMSGTDGMPPAVPDRHGLLIHRVHAQRWLSFTTGRNNGVPVSAQALRLLTTVNARGQVFGPGIEENGRALVASREPLATVERKVDASLIRRKRLDGRWYGWYCTDVHPDLLRHAVHGESLSAEDIVTALRGEQNRLLEQLEELQDAVRDAAVESARSNGSSYVEHTREMLEELGLDSDGLVRTRRLVTSRVMVEIEVQDYVDDPDEDVDNYEIEHNALEYGRYGEEIHVSFDGGYFDEIVGMEVICTDVSNTDYTEEEVDD